MFLNSEENVPTAETNIDYPCKINFSNTLQAFSWGQDRIKNFTAHGLGVALVTVYIALVFLR